MTSQTDAEDEDELLCPECEAELDQVTGTCPNELCANSDLPPDRAPILRPYREDEP